MTKTTNRPLAELQSDFVRVGALLQQAREDVETLRRLSMAEAQAETLAAELDAIKRQIDRALVDEDKAKEDAFIAGIKDVRITEGDARENLIRRTFTVHVTRTGNDGQRDWETTAEKTGLTSLRAEEYAWLLRHPERIPASILALADDPRTAFQTYFGGKKRGYFRGA
ncbi:hypothetical protein [Brevundimonas diminuta]|uniref:hypothetical protein n=1 Tax=Brevundimonas diminuta TaxID=293 RepID=UPI003F814772